MAGASPLPRTGDVFFDARGEDRALRISRHSGAGIMVLSLWKAGVCTATFRLPDSDVPLLVTALARESGHAPDGLAGAGGPLEWHDMHDMHDMQNTQNTRDMRDAHGTHGTRDAGASGWRDLRPPRPAGTAGPAGTPRQAPPDRRVFPATDEHRIPPPA